MKLEKPMYTTGEVARMLGVSAFAVWTWIKKGRLNAWKTPGGQYRIPAEEVERLLRESGTLRE